MSQSVDKLKHLLFENENRAITDLAHTIERVALTEAGHRTEIKKRLEVVFSRTGTQERFRASVADVLDGALRDAEVEHHDALSDAVAPLVVNTVKTEITNSQDELVEALYPMTGRMVKSYVASAIKDLTQQINRTLEHNPLVLRLNSLMTGRSIAELALADAQALQVDELYLIRRGSGELIARWPNANASANRDQVMSGILTAINEFAIEAFQSEGTTLRQIDLGDSQVYLRGSPTYLLAAKCTGTATSAIETTIDDEFLEAIESQHDLAGDAKQNAGTILSDLATRLTDRINTYYDQNAAGGTGANPAKFILWIIGLALVAWLGWTLFNTFLTQRTHAKATYVLQGTAQMAGYPANIDTSDYGRALTISGLTPSPDVRRSLIERLRAILPSTRIDNQLTVVNSNFPDHRPELSGLQRKVDGLSTWLGKLNTGVDGLTGNVSGLESGVTGLGGRLSSLNNRLNHDAITRATTRASARLTASLPDLTRLSNNLDDSKSKTQIDETRTAITTIIPQINAQHRAANDTGQTNADLAKLQPALIDLARRIERASRNIAPVLIADNPAGTGNTPQPSGTKIAASPNLSLSEAAENLALQAEHFATLAAASSQASAMRAPPPPTPSPRERLESWTRANAIFFANGTEFASPRAARAKLRRLAGLAKDTGTLVRIVGFTDEKGAQPDNTTLSLARASLVRRILMSEGVRPNTLVAVGRNNSQELSPTAGERSPNRRVQFELGFIGERSR